MTTTQRDHAVVLLVARFSQLSSSQLQQLVFTDVKSRAPAHRTLTRLSEQQYLRRIERRIVGGSHGGSGQYVYQLGIEGHKLHKEGRYIPARVVSHHSLAIADCFITVTELARAGKLGVTGYLTEPDCHVVIQGHDLKPDLYLELVRPGGERTIRLMIEVDMASQGANQITAKFVRYWRAYQDARDGEWPDDQIVLFVAVDDERAEELKWLLDRGAKEQQALFRVTTGAKLADAIGG